MDALSTLFIAPVALGVSRNVARAVVNHADGKVDAIYNRYDYGAEKREALEKWAKYLEALAKM